MKTNQYQKGFDCFLDSVDQKIIKHCEKELSNTENSKFKNRIISKVKDTASSYLTQANSVSEYKEQSNQE